MNLQRSWVILLGALGLTLGRAAEVKAPEPVYVSGKVEFQRNGLTFLLTVPPMWELQTTMDKPTIHLTSRDYYSRDLGSYLSVSGKNAPSPAANLESAANEYQEQILAAGRVKLLGFTQGVIDGLPAGFFSLQEVGEVKGPGYAVVGITVLHGQTYIFAFRTLKERPETSPVYRAIMASVKISRSRPPESRVPVPVDAQPPDQIIGDLRFEKGLPANAGLVKDVTRKEQAISRLGPPDSITTDAAGTALHYTFGRFNYHDSEGVEKHYEVLFNPNGTYRSLRTKTTRVTKPFPSPKP
jgi:hypothetical protein